MNNSKGSDHDHDHDHVLDPQDVTQYGDMKSFCHLCGTWTGIPSCRCKECGLYFHELCAKAPSEIPRHPFHPQHPLTLIADRSKPRRTCRACSWPEKSVTFSCLGCEFHLEVSCALATVPDGDEEDSMLQHFMHDHPLIRFRAKEKTNMLCVGCRHSVEGEAYGCGDCSFFLDKECAELPQDLVHPFHHHRLDLCMGYSNCYQCKVCSSHSNQGYFCGRCRIYFDKACLFSILLPEGGTDDTLQRSVKYVGHDHALSLFVAKPESSIRCHFCEKNLSGEAYGCPDCLFFIHKECAEFPSSIQHPLHQQHAMTIVSRSQGYHKGNCKNCWMDTTRLAFSCGECGVDLHVVCALETLKYLNSGERPVLGSIFHEHWLEISHRMGNAFFDCCKVCQRSVLGLGYICGKDGWVVHKSCALLPRQLQHPFHPKHQLTLYEKSRHGSFDCDACGRGFGGYVFSCVECGFDLDPTCALRTPTLKHPLHEHLLAYFEEAKNYRIRCNKCGEVGNANFYRCVVCNFNLHPECLPLPSKVKHKDHVDVLTLFNKYLEDDSGEYYCDLCTKRRHPDHGAYCCLECKLYAHIHCALSWDVKITDDLALDETEEEIARLNQELDDMKLREKEQLEKIGAAKTKRSAIWKSETHIG